MLSHIVITAACLSDEKACGISTLYIVYCVINIILLLVVVKQQ